MLRPGLVLALILSLAACDGLVAPRDAALRPPEGMTRPAPRPEAAKGSALSVPAGAATAEALDTTSAAERSAALAAAASPAGSRLGETIASLGNPADPGFWLETPLARVAGPGRVVVPATGASVALELRPIAGPPGAGSRISLAALRLLGLDLAGLHALEVFAD